MSEHIVPRVAAAAPVSKRKLDRDGKKNLQAQDANAILRRSQQEQDREYGLRQIEITVEMAQVASRAVVYAAGCAMEAEKSLTALERSACEAEPSAISNIVLIKQAASGQLVGLVTGVGESGNAQVRNFTKS